MADIAYELIRTLHTPEEPGGVPYIPPAPEPGKGRRRLVWPQRVRERWVASRNGAAGAGRTKLEAKAALRRAEAS
jgi:hypothetical protein